MKLRLPILWVFLASVDSFAHKPHVAKTISSSLPQGRFDSKSFYGGGGGGVTQKDLLDEQWETQQDILRARRGRTDKEYLKRKYTTKAKENFPSRTNGVIRVPANNDAQNPPDPDFSWANY